jgi:hypothetical protein
MLSTFMDVFTDFLYIKIIYICGFSRKFFTRELSRVNYGKKSIIDNIGPWLLHQMDKIEDNLLRYVTNQASVFTQVNNNLIVQ